MNNSYVTPLKKTKSNLSDTERAKAYLGKKDGKTVSEIARETERPYHTIWYFTNGSAPEKKFEPKHKRKGRYPRGKTSLSDLAQRLIKTWIRNEEVTSTLQASKRLSRIVTIKRCSYRTVLRFVHTLGKWIVPQFDTEISEKNKALRLKYCKMYRGFDFRKVLFSDESSV